MVLTEGRPDETGLTMARALDDMHVPVIAILDSAIAYALEAFRCAGGPPDPLPLQGSEAPGRSVAQHEAVVALDPSECSISPRQIMPALAPRVDIVLVGAEDVVKP